jgi:hypothetical protein
MSGFGHILERTNARIELLSDAHALGGANVARDAVDKLYTSDTKRHLMGCKVLENLPLHCLARVLLLGWCVYNRIRNGSFVPGKRREDHV